MYRIISASADTYITSKIIENSRSLDANVGMAGTLDIYKLYDETVFSAESGSIIELSRGLIKFDYSNFSDKVDIASPAFTASIILKSVYGGQTTPSNFTLALYPLSRAFDEGRGFDVASYKDIDTANFLKSSTGVLWNLSGANATGSLGETVDIIVSGNIGSGIEGLGSYCRFTRGDEDARFNVTKIVSASIAGIIPNHGFRLSFVTNEEQDAVTRFVKRFGTKQALNKELHPKLVVEDDDRILDTSSYPTFDVSQSLFTYNFSKGNPANFVLAGVPITGANCLKLHMIASKSVSYLTNSYQSNFLATITHKTSSTTYFSQSFSASQYDNKTGIYYSEVMLDLTNNTYLSDFVSSSNEINFEMSWRNNAGTVTFAKKHIKFNRLEGNFSNAIEPNYFVNIINLKQEYSRTQDVRFKIFVQDRTSSVSAMKITEAPKSVTFTDMRWRLLKAYSKTVVVPFSESTRLSSDSECMYFDFFMSDLDVNEVYEIELVIKNSQGKDILVADKAFTFKVVE